MDYAIKAEIGTPNSTRHTFVAARTMDGGKKIGGGDRVFLFANETRGGAGLIAKGFVTPAEALARAPGIARQPPRVTVEIDRRALAMAPLGRTDLRGFTDWGDGKPETELNFKLCRQATNKIVGPSATTAQFLDGFF
jgi:hypothetical protein